MLKLSFWVCRPSKMRVTTAMNQQYLPVRQHKEMKVKRWLRRLYENASSELVLSEVVFDCLPYSFRWHAALTQTTLCNSTEKRVHHIKMTPPSAPGFSGRCFALINPMNSHRIPCSCYWVVGLEWSGGSESLLQRESGLLWSGQWCRK